VSTEPIYGHPEDRPNAGPHPGYEADADVVDLSAARGRLSPDTRPDTAPDTGEDIDPDAPDVAEEDTDEDTNADIDRESVEVVAVASGRPVYLAEDGVVVGEVLARSDAGRLVRPIVPSWARSWQSAYLTSRRWALDAGHVSLYHLTRSPKYAVKTAGYGALGLARATGRLVGWAMAEEGNWHPRQTAATRGDAETWLKLDRARERQSRWRWWVTVPALLALLAAVLVLAFAPLPLLWRAAGVTVLLTGFARVGRPADGRITDRVAEGQAYRKLTADLVRRGLMSLSISGITQAVGKDPGAISFPTEIHRDGPGHLAVVDLPYGVTAADVCARRGRLASALRLPLDQVWPEVTREHPGRLHLWVGYEPASAMRQPDWPLLKGGNTAGGKVDIFKGFAFGTDPRLRPVEVELMYRNWLFGGQPGSGKTFALRLLPLAASLDPRVELRGYELKGVGDFKALAPVLSEYGNGFDDATIGACAAMVEWLYAECQRRSKRIDFYAAKGKCPENKVTSELASLKGSGLHPLVVFIDESQELFRHPVFGKKAGETAEKVIKLGRALGVILMLGTQIPDKDSLPTGITRNVNSRYCLSVADQTANDMILGTSAYKLGHRATVFEPGTDAGWGILAGMGKTAAYRSFYVDSAAAAKLIARAVELRKAAGTLPVAPELRETGPAFDLLADLVTVWPATEDGRPEDAAWNEALVTALAELRPDTYAGWEAAQLTTALKPHPAVEIRDVGRRIDGKPVTRRGFRRADLAAAITERDRAAVADRQP
jgi:DNA segregation ATPase FtsK/SpoIIIE, S-DNA-T family